MYAKYIKRMLDFILSLIALIVLSPLMIIIGILVRIKLGKPVIFKQKRPGKNEKIFTLYKFRTMTHEKDEQGNLVDTIKTDKNGIAVSNEPLVKGIYTYQEMIAYITNNTKLIAISGCTSAILVITSSIYPASVKSFFKNLYLTGVL